MAKPRMVSVAKLDRLRQRMATRGSAITDILDAASRSAFADGDLASSEELEDAIELVVGYVDDLVFLSENGCIPAGPITVQRESRQ